MKRRLIEFLTYLGIGQNKFEEKVGLSIGYINKLKGDMKLNTVNKIISSYPELDKEWLTTGEGEMLKNSNIGYKTSGNHSPITGNMEINSCLSELDKANIKIQYLERILKDKEEIIELLKNKNNA